MVLKNSAASYLSFHHSQINRNAWDKSAHPLSQRLHANPPLLAGFPNIPSGGSCLL